MAKTVIRIIALTHKGHELALKLEALLSVQMSEKSSEQLSEPATVSFKPKPFAETVQQFFQQGERLIFICATGIVMRTLAPVLENKHQDPAVLVLDENGQFVIPLLSGHEGGANHWASEVADLLQAQAVITSACEYLNPIYTVGMGCERGCPAEELEQLLMNCLDQAGLNLSDINAISSIDIKADEVGLIQLAKRLNKPFQTWSADQLKQVEDKLSVKSDYVFNTVGVYGVAESAALFSAQTINDQPSELVLVKQKTKKATCAIARSFAASHVDNA